MTSIGSQSWSPDVIYGYSNSTAEDYAAENGYVFYALDGEDSGDADDDTTEIQTGNANYEDAGEETDDLTIDIADEDVRADVSSSGGNSSTGNSSGSGTISSSSTSTTSSTTSGAYASTTSNVHEVDNTPKTGDGFEPKFLICIAFVLIGCGCFFLAKRKTE